MHFVNLVHAFILFNARDELQDEDKRISTKGFPFFWKQKVSILKMVIIGAKN